tara:strand:+ start:4261 stop:4683 length:423 start_codon:yes stop_codon:yes gene_type:complete
MSKKYKIILDYINDLSVEIKDPEALLIAREKILKYKLDIDISSKPLKNKMIEINTKLTYHDKEIKKKEIFFQIIYATVIQLEHNLKNKKELEKIILCDVQKDIYPKLEKIFLNIIKDAGFPTIKFSKKIDFDQLFSQQLN